MTLDLLNPPNFESHPGLRECKSCWRDLPVNSFGIDRLAKDGYSKRCRECNAYNRRFGYNRKHEELIVPLYMQNRHVIETIGLPTAGTVTFSARGVKDRGYYLAVIEIKRGSPSLTVTNSTGDVILGQYLCLGASKAEFQEQALAILRQLRLRLSS